jgi:hypothetical protein
MSFNSRFGFLQQKYFNYFYFRTIYSVQKNPRTKCFQIVYQIQFNIWESLFWSSVGMTTTNL